MNTRFASIVIALSLSLSINSTVYIVDAFNTLYEDMNTVAFNNLKEGMADVDKKQTTLESAQEAFIISARVLYLGINSVIEETFKHMITVSIIGLEKDKIDLDTKEKKFKSAQAALKKARTALVAAFKLAEGYLEAAEKSFFVARKKFNNAYNEISEEKFNDDKKQVGYCFHTGFNKKSGQFESLANHHMLEDMKYVFFEKNLSAFIGEKNPTADFEPSLLIAYRKNLSAFIGKKDPTTDDFEPSPLLQFLIKARDDVKERIRDKSFMSTLHLYDFRYKYNDDSKEYESLMKGLLSDMNDGQFKDEDENHSWYETKVKLYYIKLYKCLRQSNKELQQENIDTISQLKSADELSEEGSERVLLMV